MKQFELTVAKLKKEPKTWLLTGVAGFIGSNILEFLLSIEQRVVGIDNFATGYRSNLKNVESSVLPQQWKNFNFIEGTICDLSLVQKAMNGVSYVLHQAALGSVPRSIENPLVSNEANITGFLTMLTAAKEQQIESFTYAASSSTYGDHPDLPKVENKIGNPLSPYAVTKLVNELYADVFKKTYDFNSIGLRYFNVYGRRQNINGAYAAVIPKWISALIAGEQIQINGDGETSRDFCYIDNAIQMNILAATADSKAQNQIYNVALGDRTSLNTLFSLISKELTHLDVEHNRQAYYDDFRAGDVRHSQANIEKAQTLLGYTPEIRINQGIQLTVDWFVKHLGNVR